jgi:hypothetical protein
MLIARRDHAQQIEDDLTSQGRQWDQMIAAVLRPSAGDCPGRSASISEPIKLAAAQSRHLSWSSARQKGESQSKPGAAGLDRLRDASPEKPDLIIG